MLDIFAFINFAGVGQALFWAGVLLNLKRKNSTPNRILAFFLLLLAFGVTSATLYMTRYIIKIPHLGTKATQDLTKGPQYSQLISLSQFDGPLHNPETIRGKLEFVGSGSIKGKPAFKLKLTDPDGTLNYMYLDKKSYFLTRQVTLVEDDSTGKEIEVITLFKDYRKIGGVYLAYRYEIISPQGTNNIVIDSIEMNEKIENAFFARSDDTGIVKRK